MNLRKYDRLDMNKMSVNIDMMIRYFFNRFIIVLACFSLLLSGCAKRYWYRVKVPDTSLRLKKIRLTTYNNAPNYISSEFINEAVKGCVKILRREGYVESKADSPDFEMVVYFDMDFLRGVENMYVGRRDRTGGGYVHGPFFYQEYGSGQPKSMDIKCQFRSYQTGVELWYNEDYLYYFGRYKRDVSRTQGMVRYLMRDGFGKYRLGRI